jgi:hypothetical protein
MTQHRKLGNAAIQTLPMDADAKLNFRAARFDKHYQLQQNAQPLSAWHVTCFPELLLLSGLGQDSSILLLLSHVRSQGLLSTKCKSITACAYF